MSDTATDAPTATAETSAKGRDHEGEFIWYELMTSDQDGAIDFYKTVVGWNAADFPNPEIGDFRYTILSVGDRGVAGVMTISEEMKAHGVRPAWTGVIAVADADDGARKLAEAGGTVHKGPADIPTVGRFAVVADPGGAVFQLLAPFPQEKEPAPLAPETVGKVGWHELYSSAGEKASFDFYSRLYGWKTDTEMDMGPMGKYRIFSKDGVQLGGMMDKPENVPASAWTFYINVDGIDAAVERVKAKGGQIVMGPMEVPGGSWVIQGIDPQGAHFALVSLKR
jgi:uncharacterized protein